MQDSSRSKLQSDSQLFLEQLRRIVRPHKACPLHIPKSFHILAKPKIPYDTPFHKNPDTLIDEGPKLDSHSCENANCLSFRTRHQQQKPRFLLLLHLLDRVSLAPQKASPVRIYNMLRNMRTPHHHSRRNS